MDHHPFTDEYVGPVGPLVISGEITPGDSDRLLSRILGDEDRFLAQNKVLLASDGGDVAEALKIAKLLKSLDTEVIIAPSTGRCVSACFFIYAAASRRATDGERLIGINRPFIDSAASPLPEGATAAAESDALARVRAFLRENDVPGYLVEEMFRRASDDLYWLSARDEANLGYQSAAFGKILAVQCGWEDKMAGEVYAGKRPIEELKQMLSCRERVTRAAAHDVLAQAAKIALGRGRPAPGAPVH